MDAADTPALAQPGGPLDILDAIYDAALDHTRWPAALSLVCAFVRCRGGVIVVVDTVHLSATVLWWAGYTAAQIAALTPHSRQNGLLRDSLRRDVCEVTSLSDVRDIPSFQQTDTFNRWAGRNDVVDAMQAILDRTATTATIVAFSSFRENGLIDEDSRQRLALLAPHLRRAVLIGRTIERHRLAAEDFAQTIDALAAGVFMVDADMNLLYANKSGHALLARNVLRLAGSELRANDRNAQQALAQSVAASVDSDTRLQATRAMTVLTAPGSDQTYGAYALPLGSGMRQRLEKSYSAAAAVFVHPLGLHYPGPVLAITARFALTPGEARTLLIVAEVRSVPAAAMMLGLSQATVKTHLRSIFRKTGTQNQADLVALVAAHASPIS